MSCFRVASSERAGRYCVATKNVSPGTLILSTEALALAVNDALVNSRCVVCGNDGAGLVACRICRGAMCAACDGAEHGCAVVTDADADSETRLARLVAVARAADREGLARRECHFLGARRAFATVSSAHVEPQPPQA